MFEVEYANLPLHDYVNIREIKRTLMPPRENFTKSIPAMHGEFYMGYKYGSKKITLTCDVGATDRVELMEKLGDLAFILDVKSPSKFIASDMPDRYNYAVINGTIDIENIILSNGIFNLEFICYDPITYSIEPDEFYDDGSHKMKLINSGSTDAYPVLSVAFSNPAYFFQCTNTFTGDTVLVGTPKNVDKTDYTFNSKVLRDNCETLTNWNTVGNIVDNATVNGSLSINAGGWGIYCNNIGSGDGWHGGARRKNLGQELQDFRVKVKMQHNSRGDLNGTGAGSTPPSTSGGTSVQYKITADPNLRIRSGRGTSHKIVGSIPKGKVVSVSDIQSNWGKVTYSGKTGYISMQYTKKYTTSSTSSSSNSYKITADPSLRVRSGRGTKYSTLTKIPKGKIVTVTDIKSNWGKVTYSGKTGYIPMQYAKKQSSSRASQHGSAEENLGRVEVYGFDKNGQKLFKFAMKDTEQYYEYSEPTIDIGSKEILNDNKKCPAPKTRTEKDGDKTVKVDINSGKFGEWNDFVGWFTIERTTENEKIYWNCKVEKLNDAGKVVKTLTSGKLSNSSYPTGKLSNLVIFIGGHGNADPVEIMTINEIYVDNLGTPPKPEQNKPIFANGDELTIDFNTQKVYKNGLSMMDELDIGSVFFELPVGSSQITCRSEDKEMDVITSIQKRWI